MDKKVLDMLMEIYELENILYDKLEVELGSSDKAEEFLGDFVDYREKTLKIGKYLDEEKAENKSGFLTDNYESLPKYLKVCVIYTYDNGYSLCETTTGLIVLVPTELVSFETI